MYIKNIQTILFKFFLSNTPLLYETCHFRGPRDIRKSITHFFTYMYIKNAQTTLFKLLYQTPPYCMRLVILEGLEALENSLQKY